MSEMENIEIRVCLIGEAGIGKKSIISRFKILNTSQTTNENKVTDVNGKKELPKLTSEFFSSKYTGREKTKLMNLISFTKILTISNVNLELKFYPISSADNIEFADKINEDDEALKEHKMKFDNIKSEIEKVIIKQPTNPYAEVKILFLFILDLQNYDQTFEKIKIYHEELNKYLNIDSKYYKALIGNKVDIKNGNIDRENLQEFINSKNFLYHEISTKMFFNFEKFFEKLFFEIFENTNKQFTTYYFKERFSYVMSFRPTFTRAERAPEKPNNYPGPQRYDSNVYNIDSIKPVFGKERYNKKIFINKKGPIFDFKNEVYLKKQSKQSKSTAKPIQNKKLNTSREEDSFETAEKKRKLKEDMFGYNPGFSLGIKPSQMNLRKKKKEDYKKLMQSFEEIFDLNNITKEKPNRSNSVNISAKITVHKRKEFLLKQKIEKFKKNRERIKPQKKESNNLKKNRSNSEDSERSSKNRNLTNGNTIKTVTSIKTSIASKQIKRAKSQRIINKKTQFVVPGPAAYDVRGKIDLSKGFTFGGKYEINEMKNNYAPPYLYLDSDIEMMLKQPKFAFKKGFAPRFKDFIQEQPGDLKQIESKIKFMEENKIMELNKKLSVIKEREDKRDKALQKKENQDENYYRKLEEQIIKKEEKENLKRIAKGLKPIDYSTINYNLVEENAPMYTIKGRYEKGFLNVQENFEDPSRLHGLEQSVSYLSKNLTKNLNQLPNYSAVKQNLPSFSIPKADRFQEEKLDKLPGPMSYFHDKYYEVETKPGSNKIAYMGTAKRYKDFMYSEIPGPGQYKLKGFSDEIIKEAEKKMNFKNISKMNEHLDMNGDDEMMERINENDMSLDEKLADYNEEDHFSNIDAK